MELKEFGINAWKGETKIGMIDLILKGLSQDKITPFLFQILIVDPLPGSGVISIDLEIECFPPLWTTTTCRPLRHNRKSVCSIQRDGQIVSLF